MPDHDFEHLSDKNFERMATALCAEHIARGLRIYGSGTDGGREATFEGKMNYPAGGQVWDGYLVVQCKQKQARATPKEEAAWAIGQLNSEMERYRTAKRKRRIPDYFLFITNAHLSAQQETGGKDKFIERLDYWKQELGMQAADVWDRDKLNNLVDITPKVAQRFGLLHSGNLIHYVAQAFLSQQAGVETTLAVFLQEELRADQYVSLAQTDDRPPLARVFMDLRARSAANPAQDFLVVAEVQRATDQPLHPSLLKEEREAMQEAIRAGLDEEPDDEEAAGEVDEQERRLIQEINDSLPEDPFSPARYVLVGGPGQGKSTLGQQLAQRHRAALLKADATKTLELETSRMLQLLEAAASEAGTGLPTYPRWPFRIALEDFASALTANQVESVLEYMAFLVRKRTKRPFSAHEAELLLSHAPLLVVFDGLDEVPAVSNRAQVLAAVRRFLFEARDKDADLLVVATTRPQGYEAEFAEFGFTELTLQLLSQKEALAYARKLLEVKYAADSSRRERLMERMQAAAREPAIWRLMMSPLQITIMVALVDVVGILPRERYLLFERYYEIIYEREQERGLTLSQVLSDYRTTIEILHDRIGLLLQVEAESQGKTESRLSGERLQGLVQAYLIQEEYRGEELTRLTSTFMEIALHRLVFIVPAEDERYGFEVRSLQEFSAARALMREDYTIVKERLRVIAPVPYWRNTLLFAIGQAFARQHTQHQDLIMQLCRELDDADDTVLARTRAGSRLALDMLEEGIVTLQPKYRNQVLILVLQLLRLAHVSTAERLVQVYTAQERERYKREVQAVMGSSEFEEVIGLFVVLVKLAHHEEEVWAEPLLQQHWPVAMAQQQVLLEIPLSYKSGPWFQGVLTRVASASSLEWVIDNLRRVGGEVDWIHEASRLRFNREQKVYLAGENPQFYFTAIWEPVEPAWLDSLPLQQLGHHDWLPFTLGQAFMRNPSPETLAETLEALVHAGGWAPGQDYEALPWQLHSLLTDAQSTEELLLHAQRARRGELGTAQDWQAAETRWQAKHLTVEDLACFADSEWPYSEKIARCGFLPAGAFGLDNIKNKENASARTLLKAFSTAASRYRLNLAVAFFFVVGGRYNTAQPLTLPLDALVELVLATPWHVFGLTMLSLLDTDLDWVGEVKTLDLIGSRISVLGNREHRNSLVGSELMPNAVAQLVPLVGTKHIREGILRWLATLAVAGAEIPVPDVDPARLSAEGQVALATLNLFGRAPLLSATRLTQLVEGLWNHAHPRTTIAEIRRVLRQVCERTNRPLTGVAGEVLDNLYAGTLVDARLKLDILNCFMAQLQHRTSSLADPTCRMKLATDWLFAVRK